MKNKKYQEKAKLVEPGKVYSLHEAAKLIKETAHKKFDETIDLAIHLGVDPKRTDQQVRGTVLLPAGSGRKIRLVVIAKGDKIKEAEEAGADFVGGEDMIAKISKGWLDFDRVIATPDMMGQVGKLGKVLGQRGLMPNPKAGTVTFDIGQVVKEFKAGKVEFKADKTGNLHLPLGKVSFTEEKIYKNMMTVLETVIKAKPASVKGVYLRSATVSSTMGPGIKIDARKILVDLGRAED